MATYKGVGFDNTSGRIRTATSSDDIEFAAQITALDGAAVTGEVSSTTLSTTGDASIGGDLTVAGDIVSRGEVNLVVEDPFIDLGVGNSSTTAEAGGFTFSMNRNSGFTAETITAASIGVASPAVAPTLTSSTNPSQFATGDLLVLTGSDNNNGIFVVNGVSGATITLKGTGGVAIDGAVPFAQSNVETESGQTATAYKVDIKVLLVADGSANFTDAGGSTYAQGTIVETFQTNASEGDFTSNGDYTALGAGSVTLQSAYDNGQSITVDGDNLTIDDTTENTNDFDIGGTTAFANFNATAQAIQITTSGTSGADLALLFADDASSSAIIGYGVTPQLTVTNADVQISDDLTMNKATGGTQQITKSGSGAAGDDLVIQVTGNEDSSLILQSEGNGTDALKLATLTNSGSIDIDSAAAIDILAATTFSIDGTGASNVTATSGNLTVSTVTSGNLVLTSAADVDLTAAAELDIGAASSDIDITGALAINSGDTTNLTMDADADSTKTLTIQANNTNVGASAEAEIVIDADDRIKLQNAGTDKMTVGSSSVIFDTTIQASSTGGFKFGSGGNSVDTILDEDDMASDDVNALATQQSIKAYVDADGISNFLKIVELNVDESVAKGDLLALKVTGGDEGRVIKADADAIATCNVIGFALAAQGSVGSPVKIAQTGILGGFSGLTAGNKLFASTTAGGVTATAPSGSGDVVFQVGFATSASQIVIQPMFIMEIG